jgi:hypothetical protein
MTQTPSFVTLAFVAGLGIGLFVRSAVMAAPQQVDTHAADLAAIEKLHRADEQCTLTQDPKCLATLWSDDGIKVDALGGPVMGIKAIGEMYAKFRAQFPEFKVLKYAPHYEDMQTAIVDEWAIEVGSNTDATYQISANATPVTVPKAKGMRLLKRQPDGSWKFAVCCMK